MKNVGMMNRAVAMGIVVAAGLASSASMTAAAVGPIEVIYCKKTGHPKAAFTGSVDINGNPENVEWKAMEDMIVSPDGSRWVLEARSTSAGTSDSSYVVGSGTTGSVFNVGGFRFQEGQPAMTSGGGTDGFFDFIPGGFARFNTSNKMVFSFRARTTTTGSTSSPAAMRVATWDGTNLVFRFKMTDPYSGMQDTGGSGDETVGNSAGSYHLLDNDTIGNHDPNPGSLSSTRYPVLAYDLAMFKQTGVSSWLALDGSTTLLATTIDAGSFFTTPDGQHHMLMFKSGPIATRISHFVKDGQVLFSQDVAITGSSVVPGAFFQNTMANNGDYMLRGRDNSGTSAAAPDWVVRNGVLVAKTGDPITPGSTELWGDTISAVALNGTGDYIIVGNTSAGDAGANEVVVLNGTTVVMREGDAIDLDGDGLDNDNAFIGRGVNTQAAFGASTTNGQTSWSLTNDKVLYGIIHLRDGSGADINIVPAFGTPQAFVRIDLDEGGGCTADFNGTGGVTADDIFAFLDAWFAQNGTCTSNCSADFNGAGGVTADDIFAFLDAWFAQNGTCN